MRNTMFFSRNDHAKLWKNTISTNCIKSLFLLLLKSHYSGLSRLSMALTDSKKIHSGQNPLSGPSGNSTISVLSDIVWFSRSVQLSTRHFHLSNRLMNALLSLARKPRHLCASSSHLRFVPIVETSIVCRSFTVSAPTLWNSHPVGRPAGNVLTPPTEDVYFQYFLCSLAL